MQLDPLVKPRSVAIVGATDRVGPARSVIESLGAIGFPGAIYPVNPKYQTVRNLVCYPSLTDLPEAPDVVVFSIRKPLLPEQVRLAVKRGARAAVIYDAGFAERGEDGARQQAENALGVGRSLLGNAIVAIDEARLGEAAAGRIIENDIKKLAVLQHGR